jgi:hypothetical protein
MSRLTTVGCARWTEAPHELPPGGVAAALESGDVLFLPGLEFDVRPSEGSLFYPAIV